MDTECDVDHKRTLSNIIRFPNPPNLRLGRPIQTNLLTVDDGLRAGGLTMRVHRGFTTCLLRKSGTRDTSCDSSKKQSLPAHSSLTEDFRT